MFNRKWTVTIGYRFRNTTRDTLNQEHVCTLRTSLRLEKNATNAFVQNLEIAFNILLLSI